MNGEYHMTMDPSEKDALSMYPGEYAGSADKSKPIRAPRSVRAAAAPSGRQVQGTGRCHRQADHIHRPADAVRVDYLWLTQSSALTNVSLQFESRDLHFQSDGNKSWATVNIVGRISSTTRRPVATFEYPLEVHASDGLHAVYQKSVPLAPGPYRLDIVARTPRGAP